MEPVKRRPFVPVVLLALVGCDDLQGFSGETPPLATIRTRVTGDAAGTEAPLHVALVWGAQWLPEPLCILPSEDPALAPVLAEGCRNPLAFTPSRVAQTTAIELGVEAELPLLQLPSADVMVGDLTGRIAYGSLVVFEDRDGDDALTLRRPTYLPDGEYNSGGDGGDGPMPGGGGNNPCQRGPDEDECADTSEDVVRAASFVAMTEPDRRVAFREGAFLAAAFYPRARCGEPLPAFSVLSAGGFTFEAAVAATIAGTLPPQDPATCAESTVDDTVIELALRPTEEVREVACEPRRVDSSVRYRDPPVEIDLEGRAFACTKIPSFTPDGEEDPTAGIVQLVVAGKADEACKSLTHYTLVGCNNGEVVCDTYVWDLRATPPAWWPCPAELP